MNKAGLEAQRTYLSKRLENIVAEAILVQEEMAEVPHMKGRTSHRSLRPKSPAYILSSEKGFMAHYQHSDGQWYEIQIYKRDYSK